MRLLILVFACCVVAACASTSQVVVTPQAVKLRDGGSVAIATPGPVLKGGASFDAGKTTASALQTAFALHSNTVSTFSECRDVACLKRRTGGSVDYLVVPQILDWDDRGLEWVNRKDKIELKIVVVDAASGKDIAATVIRGESNWFVLPNSGPNRLIVEPLNSFVASLY